MTWGEGKETLSRSCTDLSQSGIHAARSGVCLHAEVMVLMSAGFAAID